MADACSAAARPRRCAILEESATEPPTATVSWESDTRARVEVGAAGTGPRATRWVDFRPEDAEKDRWQALGLVVASLLEGSTNEAPPTPVAPVERGRPARASRAVLWMNGGAAAGRGLDSGSVRVGGWLGGGCRLPELPLYVGAGASLGAGSGGSDVTATWTAFSVRLGADLRAAPLDLIVRPYVGAVSERVVAELSAGPTTGSSGSRWLDGATLGAEVSWPARSVVSLVLGADATWLTGGTAVRLDGREIASFPALGYEALVGVQVTLVHRSHPAEE